MVQPVRLTDWDVYRFGLQVGIRAFPIAPWVALKRLVLPIEYIRCVEFRYVLDHLEVAENHLVLDIGSPKLLSLFLAARVGARVWATDLVDYFFAAYGVYARSVLGEGRDRYTMETQDAQALAYKDETFDRVFSVSVIEHISGDGDTSAMHEIARVLKPGGIVCLTVPWSDRGYIEEFHRPDLVGGYWMKPGEKGERVFYQRAYDRDSMRKRLLVHDQLHVVDLSFWGERRIAVQNVLLNLRLPRLIRYAMCPAHFALNRLFLSPLEETEPSRCKAACVTLRKEAN
jgi:SAM-dependent methyltransferase